MQNAEHFKLFYSCWKPLTVLMLSSFHRSMMMIMKHDKCPLDETINRGSPIKYDLVPKGVQEKRTEVLENKVDRMWVSNAFFWMNTCEVIHQCCSRSWEIWLSVWFVTVCRTLHITTSPHHCAANHAVNCENPTDLTRCDPHEYYQVNPCSSVSHRTVSHRTACYA